MLVRPSKLWSHTCSMIMVRENTRPAFAHKKLLIRRDPNVTRLIDRHRGELGLNGAFQRPPRIPSIVGGDQFSGESACPAVLLVAEVDRVERESGKVVRDVCGGSSADGSDVRAAVERFPRLSAIGGTQDGARPAHRPAEIRIQEVDPLQIL